MAILDVILEGIQIIDRDWRYLHLNDTAAMHGKSTRQALLGRTMMECYPGIEQTDLFTVMQRCRDEGRSEVLQTPFTFPDGSTGVFELRIQPVPQGLCILSLDVTARAEAEVQRAIYEERLHHAQHMEALGQLAEGVAHDFNNLLAVILGQIEVAQRRPGGPLPSDLRVIETAARSSADLTRQLLAYGRRAPLRREVLDPPELLRALEPILRRSLGATVELRIESLGPVAHVEADRAQLQQVIMNLAVNARDAIADRGRIDILLSTVAIDADHAAAHPGLLPGRYSVIQVSDTGAGMDAATQARIFEPFFTTKERGRGTGLGLATVYGVVKQHGGNIWVYSEPGLGTTFKVYLPASMGELSSAPVPDAPLLTKANGERVLVVEDVPELADLLCEAFQSIGYEVLRAARGDEGLALWHQHPDDIALLVTDVMLPGMTGPELVAHCRADRPGLRVICTSGYANAQLVEKGRMPKDVVFVEKPFSLSNLLHKAQLLLGAR